MRERESIPTVVIHIMCLPTKCSIVFIEWRIEEKDVHYKYIHCCPVTVNPQVYLEVVQYIKNQA